MTGRRRAADIRAALARRACWLRVLASEPRLAGGPYIGFGLRTRVTFGPGGRLDRGHRVTVADDFTAFIGAPVRLGSDVFINRWCYLSAYAGVEIGDRVRLGERVSIHDENHVYEPRGDQEQPGGGGLGERFTSAPVTIGDDVWLGANVVVTAGSSIGAGTVVGANSVVRGPLPAHVLAAGAPARVIRPLGTTGTAGTAGSGAPLDPRDLRPWAPTRGEDLTDRTRPTGSGAAAQRG